MPRPIAALATALLLAAAAQAQSTPDAATRTLSRSIFQQLIETNTTDSVGNVTTAATAMRQRLLDAGFLPADLQLLGPNPRKMNLVARYRGRPGSTLKPILVICHLDVVEARREDWTTDPFVFTEKDGFFYGRGTQDIKQADAALITSFIRMRRAGFVPNRDIVVALTADEEGGQSNGVEWLEKNHPDLMQAEFVINPDSGGVVSERGRPVQLAVEATEKTYADYRLTASNRGGHSSLPRPDNAIYQLAAALTRLEKSPSPVELNPVTRGFFTQMATIEKGQVAADMKAILQTPPNPAAAARLSKNPVYNSTLRTTCVATMLSGGHAPNALPNKATANVNCRILPGHSAEQVRQDLIRIFADPAITVQYVTDAGEVFDKGTERTSAPAPPVNRTVQYALEQVVAGMWPGLPIVPIMEPGASDSIYTTEAGLPSYGLNGFAVDSDDQRMHGKDERLGVESFYTGVEFTYRFLRALTS